MYSMSDGMRESSVLCVYYINAVLPFTRQREGKTRQKKISEGRRQGSVGSLLLNIQIELID